MGRMVNYLAFVDHVPADLVDYPAEDAESR